MSYDDLVEFQLESEEDVDSRAKERIPHIQRLIDDFISAYQAKYSEVSISCIDDLAESLSYLYFSICFAHVKPVIQEKTNRFKMGSLMELVIVKTQGLIPSGDDVTEKRRLNAIFGITAALSLINSMVRANGGEIVFTTQNAAIDKKLEDLFDDHKLWLSTKSLDELPIFVNAQFYELLEVILTAPLQVHAY